MPVRKTSREAFERINREGLVGPFQKSVYNILYHRGPLTAGEAWRFYAQENPSSTRGRNEVAKRIYELVKAGLVSPGEDKTCPVTHFKAIVWDVTDKLPVKWEKPKRIECCQCGGKGYIEEQQAKLF